MATPLLNSSEILPTVQYTATFKQIQQTGLQFKIVDKLVL